MSRHSFISHEVYLGRTFGPVELRFPLNQPGASSILGLFNFEDRRYVAKLLRTKQVDASAFGRNFTMPLARKLLRDLPIKDNPLRPTRTTILRVSACIDQCQRKLAKVNRAMAQSALVHALKVPDANSAVVPIVVNLALYNGQELLNLFPIGTRLVPARINTDTPLRTAAVIQEDVTDGTGKQAAYEAVLPLSRRTPDHLDAQFLILCALAMQLLRESHLGLDLFPHWGGRRARIVKQPNVLIRSDRTAITYVDIFGLFFPEGNVAERLGCNLLYGQRGIVPRMADSLVEWFANLPGARLV
jgi:hypothetical protein